MTDIEKLRGEVIECKRIYPHLRQAHNEEDEAFEERKRCFKAYLDRKQKELKRLCYEEK